MRHLPTWLSVFALFVAGIAVSLTGGAAPAARAEQGCSDGYTPQPTPDGIQCRPIPGLYRESGGGDQGPQGHWETRWGAFARADDGTIGLASTRPSEEDAVDAALAHCASKGGKDCNTAMTWYNQCAVVAAGQAPDGLYTPFFYKHYTIAKATKVAMKQCTAQNLKGCKVYFSDCSKAEFVR